MSGHQPGNKREKQLPYRVDQPSTWPDELRERGEKTLEAVLLRWLEDTTAQSRSFAILYVPGGDLTSLTKEDNSWKPWLESFAVQHDIPFIDPSANMLETKSQGKEVFYDHFTKDGHIAFANAFIGWFQSIE